MEFKTDLHDKKAVLIIAHPRHELRVFNWLTQAHPSVLILTDGSGRSSQSRLKETKRILDETEAKPGAIFGAYTDKYIYEAILNRRTDVFIQMAELISDVLSQEPNAYVVGDAAEGYNPAHDVCRLVINTAIQLIYIRTNKMIPSYDFVLTGPPDTFSTETLNVERSILLTLDDDMFERKLQLLKSYEGLEIDVVETFSQCPPDAFRKELLRWTDNNITDGLPDEMPYYEKHGEQRVAEGKYHFVLRRNEHMLSIAADLRDYLEQVKLHTQ
ncbi:MAG: hypothetical protein H0W44_02395 [Gammaproteobacteria bacterium]|nr:hypothetical protein [Gammaproteobacteria bacterium]